MEAHNHDCNVIEDNVTILQIQIIELRNFIGKYNVN